jgi:putative sterol carrier protein
MPVFPSKEWCEEAARLSNADPESAIAGKGWSRDIAAVVDPEPGKLSKPFTVHCHPIEGKITQLQILPDPDDLDEIEPAYLIRAPYSVWKQLLKGTLDPVEALVRRRIEVQGEVQPLIERMQYRGIAERILAKLGTTFVDEG